MKEKATIFVLLSFISACYSTTFYVNQRHPSAGDTNPGTRQLPWLTIQHAANTAATGDTVFVSTGVYHEQVILKNSGTPGNPIVFLAKGGTEVIIEGAQQTIPEWQGLVDLSEKSHIIFSGFYVQNSPTSGIFADEASHLEIKNNQIIDTASSGIGVWNSENITVHGNEVRRACILGQHECITFSNTAHFVISENHIYDSGPGNRGGEGIDIKDGCHHGKVVKNHVHDLQQIGIYIDSWERHTYQIEITKNRVHDCEGLAVASEAGGLLEDIRFVNNIVYHNQHCGLVIGNWGDASAMSRPIQNIKIINNTFFGNGWNEWGGGINIQNSEAKQIVIRNNIFSQNLSFQIANEGRALEQELIIDHNLIDGYRNYDAEITGEQEVLENPRFQNSVQHNFMLTPDSPAIDNGSSTDGPHDDFDGIQRPQGKGIDIGAFEYPVDVGVNNIDDAKEKPTEFRLYPNYPNPFNSATTFSFFLTEPNPIKFTIYNLQGQTVDELYYGNFDRGFHSVNWDAHENVGSGVYIYRLESPTEYHNGRCIYLK